MISPLRLASLSGQAGDEMTMFLPKGQLDQMKLRTFQAGYDQGFEAAQASLETKAAEHRLELSRKLQDVAFSHLEARRSILTSLRPLVAALVGKVLPTVAKQALAEIIANQIHVIATDGLKGDICIHASEADVGALAELGRELRQSSVSFTVIADPDCAEGEVWIRAPECEKQINLGLVTTRLCAEVGQFFNAEQVKSHGSSG